MLKDAAFICALAAMVFVAADDWVLGFGALAGALLLQTVKVGAQEHWIQWALAELDNHPKETQ